MDDVDGNVDDNEVWTVVKSFVDYIGINHAQISSFNNFIYIESHKVIDYVRRTVIKEKGKEYILEFGDLIFTAPTFTEKDDTSHPLYPVEALQRNTTYDSKMYVDVTVTTPSGEVTFYEKKHLGDMPVMVKSDLCNAKFIANDKKKLAKHKEDIYDIGGYFVVAPKGDGSTGSTAQRRVLVPQERAAPNKVYTFTGRKSNPKYDTYAEVRSTSGIHTTISIVGHLKTKLSERMSLCSSMD